ncbi:MAG: thiamine-phosphate kinase [Thermoleophilia bacterium]|nr:thiamine-phosphate kinase [Thermoleophilia bacterium]
MSEASLIAHIAAIAAVRPGVSVGIGDDAAVLTGDPAVVLAHDMVVQDVHFRLATAGPRDIGHKALAVNLSDVAAMGASPVAALVGIGVPRGVTPRFVEEVYEGMEELAGAWGCTIAGGDTISASELVLGVTAVGRMAPGIAPVLRSGARPGDVLWVNGALGASAAGLCLLEDRSLRVPAGVRDALVAAHLRPVPRVREGIALAAAGTRAMLDCSDGLAIDASRLAAASRVRVVLELDRVPVAPGVAAVAAALGVPADVFAATGGEDYALVVAAPPGFAPGCALVPVGRVEAGDGLVVTRGGVPVVLERLGWDHDVG